MGHSEVGPLSIAQVLDALEALYGTPSRPPVADIFGLVLWKNVAYLMDDARRRMAFECLPSDVGLSPRQISAAPFEALVRISSYGIVPEENAG